MTAKNSLLLFFFLLFLPLHLFAADSSTCALRTEDHRSNQLTLLTRIEENFRDSKWAYRQYHETLYNDFWQALQKKKEKFSKTIQAEGEVLADRYRDQADGAHEKAEEKVGELEENLKRLESLTLTYEKICFNPYPNQEQTSPKFITSYDNCMDSWNQESADLYQKLKKTVEDYVKAEKNLSEKVEKFSRDLFSDHDTLDHRFAEDLQRIDGKIQSRFFALLEKMKARFEYSWPGDKCCARCRIDQETLFDPVLNALKPAVQDPHRGATGKVVNPVNVSEAVDEMVDRERKKGRTS